MEGYAAIVAEHFFGGLIKTQNLPILNVERIEEAATQAIHPKIILNAASTLKLDASVSCVDIHVVLKSVSNKKRCEPTIYSIIIIWFIITSERLKL